MRDVYASPSYLSDPETEAYLDDLGQRLVAESSISGRTLSFFVVHDASINAFALPGGYIGVHTGLIQATTSESELAGVIAHEIGHVSQEHLSRMIAQQEQTVLPSLAALAVALLAARSNSEVASAAIATTQALSIQNQLNFTRENESEADRVGFEIMSRAGFDPHGMPGFFATLQRSNRLYDNNAPVYLRTHPLSSQRIADMEGRADSIPFKQVPSSDDYYLIRARLASMEGTPEEAVKYFQAQIRDRKTLSIASSYYGLALAYVRQNKLTDAEKALAQASAKSVSPILASLAAQINSLEDKFPKSQTLYLASMSEYPAYKPLVYGYANALIRAGKAQEAVDLLSQKINFWPDDQRIWKLDAQAQAMLGHQLSSHRAEAEALALQGSLTEAIEQINLGLKAADGDFYELSVAESRKREWQLSLQGEGGPGGAQKP